MRRLIVVVLLLAILAGAAWMLWRWDRGSAASADPWRAIPAEAAMIVEVPDALAAWDRFTHTSLLWRAWEPMRGPKRMAAVIGSVQQTLEADAALRQEWGATTVLVALLRSGQGAADALFVGPCGSLPAERLAGLLGVGAAQVNDFASGRPVACAADSAWSGLYACTREGLWLLSGSASALDEGLLQLERGAPIGADAAFTRARATLGQVTEAHVLINTERALGILGRIWEPVRIERLGLPKGWLALDLASKPDALLLNGLLVPAQDDALLRSIAEQGAGAWNIARLLPQDAVQWEVRHLGDPDAAMAARAVLDERLRATEAVASWMRGSVGVARGLAEGRRWLVAATDDADRAAEELRAPCAGTPCDTAHHRGVRMTRQPAALPLELLLGRATDLPQQPWWAILGNHVVMSDDADALRAAIEAWSEGGSLAELPRARDWFKRMSDDAAMTWWCDAGRSAALFRFGLQAMQAEGFPAWEPVLGQLGGFSVQLSPAPDGLVHVMVGLQQGSPTTPVAGAALNDGLLWSCPVGAPVSRRPELVRNHTNNTWEVLVQDSLHRIHLIAASGKLLWSRQLDGPILGPVHQVDRFRNGKLQLLLGTARTLHLIDRNGKDVGVPHKLPAPATAPLAVFDYDGEREYRVVVPLADGRLLNMDLDGAAVQGWATPKLDAGAVGPVRHLRIGGKDHLLVVDRAGGVRLFDRKGNAREAVGARLEGIVALLGVEPGQQLKATRLIWLDGARVIHATRLGGEADEVVGAGDEDGDGAPELVEEVRDALPARPLQVLALADGRAALGVPDPATGGAWRFHAQELRMPDVAARWVAGDLNLDGVRELVGADGTAVITARRPSAP